MTAPALTFLAPPSTGGGDDLRDDFLDDDAAAPVAARRGRSGARSERMPDRPDGRAPAALKLTRGAREAATGMKVSDADIRRCLDAPDDVSPDENAPTRTRFRRGNLVVLAGADGMVLRVQRRGR